MHQKKPMMRIFCKANEALSVACRGKDVILVPADSNDKSQHWIMDSSAVGNLTDDEGSKAFALVNRTTGQALVNGDWWGELELAPYSGHVCVKLSMLWSFGKERADGFKEVRVLQRHDLTLNALGGNPVKEGTKVGIYAPTDYDHAYWKIDPTPASDPRTDLSTA